jgi:hypothetical protein
MLTIFSYNQHPGITSGQTNLRHAHFAIMNSINELPGSFLIEIELERHQAPSISVSPILPLIWMQVSHFWNRAIIDLICWKALDCGSINSK